MITKWWNPHEIMVKHHKDDIVAWMEAIEWDRAKKTMNTREEKYQHSLKNVPYRFSFPWSKATAVFQDERFEGRGNHSYSAQPNEWSIIELLIWKSEEPGGEDGLYINGKLPIPVSSHEDFERIYFKELEQITRVYTARRKDLVDGIERNSLEFWDKVRDSLLEEKNLVDVSIKVNDRDIEIEGDDLHAKFDTKKCSQCNRPYWEFSDFSLISISNHHRALGAGGNSPCAEFGGYFNFYTPEKELLCTTECADAWLSHLPGDFKEEYQVREKIKSLVGDKTYDFGEVLFEKYSKEEAVDIGGKYNGHMQYAWEVNLMNKGLLGKLKFWDKNSYNIKRRIFLDLKGNVLDDISK